MLILTWIRFLRIVLQYILNFITASVRRIVICKKDFENSNWDIDSLIRYSYQSTENIKNIYYTDINIFTGKTVCIDKVHREIKNWYVFKGILNGVNVSIQCSVAVSKGILHLVRSGMPHDFCVWSDCQYLLLIFQQIYQTCCILKASTQRLKHTSWQIHLDLASFLMNWNMQKYVQSTKWKVSWTKTIADLLQRLDIPKIFYELMYGKLRHTRIINCRIYQQVSRLTKLRNGRDSWAMVNFLEFHLGTFQKLLTLLIKIC